MGLQLARVLVRFAGLASGIVNADYYTLLAAPLVDDIQVLKQIR